jgi:cytoskeletal protein RodZ
MPTCPVDRTCSWVIRGPHHDWWTTTAGALVLAFGLALLTGLLAWAALQRQRTERHRISTESYAQARATEHATEERRVRARVIRADDDTDPGPSAGVPSPGARTQPLSTDATEEWPAARPPSTP